MSSPEPVESPRSHPGRRRRAWVVAGVAALVALGAAELALHALNLPRPEQEMPFLGGLFEGDSFVEDPEMFWRLGDNNETYAANAAGLRGYWPTGTKPDRAFHVVCVGDSCTFGGGVRLEDTYAHQLERMLQEALPGRHVAAILAALPGFSSHQNRLVLRKHADVLAPDLTVLYCGGWNDYVPALGLNDPERSAQQASVLARFRLGRLIQRASARPSAPREEYVTAMKDGRAPDGRRVPTSHFRDNLLAMIVRGRAAGGKVLAILPPLPVATMRDYPICLTYARAVRDVMAQNDIPLIDGPKLFAEFEAACPKPWRKPSPNGSVCFADWVHPTAIGHGLLARSLFALIEPELAGIERGEAPRVVDMTLQPAEPIRALRATTAELRDASLSPDAVERVRLGGRWIPFERRDDSIVLRLPPALVPGEHGLRVQTTNGWLHARTPVRVLGAPVRAVVTKQPGAVELSIQGDLPAGWRTGFWIATALRTQPTLTRYGPFHLQADPDGAHPDRPELPFLFDRLQLPGYITDVSGTGVLELKRRIELGSGSTLPERVYLQGGIFDPLKPWFGALTDVIELELPR